MDAREALEAAVEAAHSAAYVLAKELDYSVSLLPSFTIPTSLLIKLDAWREAEAMMFQFLPLPIPTVVQITGPIEDQPKQAPPEYYAKALEVIQQWKDGLLSSEEYRALSAALVDEYASYS